VAAQDGQRVTRQALVSELLNALAATDVPRGLIVLDDAHRIDGGPPLAAIAHNAPVCSAEMSSR
jgi:hypothetical protein